LNRRLCFLAGILLAAGAQALQAQTREQGRVANPVVLMVIIGVISLAPFLAIMLTSFVKISVVLSLVKSALGTQVPPGQVTNGLAIVLTFFIMAPVAERMYQAADIRDTREVFNSDNLTALYQAAEKGKEPLRDFLLRHAKAPDRALFVNLAQRLERSAEARSNQQAAPAPAPQQPPQQPPPAGQPPPQQAAPPPPAAPQQPQATRANGQPLRRDEEFRVVLPAFVTSELKSAFQAGFLVLLPFLIVDVVIANVLVATGLQMIQPAIVSLPIKILLFVVADGWYLIVRGLVLSYA
jgi:type III secretion protein R